MRVEKEKETPLMKQYWQIKAFHQDKLLFFRMGDFFELFFDDAIQASEILGLTLTQRNKKAEDHTPMCGMPHHSIAGPIHRLLQRGLKVALCDQVEDPRFAKGLVKRAVTRVLTPGMVFDPDTLDEKSGHFLGALDEGSMAFVDTTTLEAFYYEVQPSAVVGLFPVREWVIPVNSHLAPLDPGAVISTWEIPFDESQDSLEPLSVRRLRSYLKSLNDPGEYHFERREMGGSFRLTPMTLDHLEIFTSSRGERLGSFLGAIDRTKSPLGARLLQQWILFPKTDKLAVESRLNELERWQQHSVELESVRLQLAQMGDLERRLGRFVRPGLDVKVFRNLVQSMKVAISLVAYLPQHEDWHAVEALLDELQDALAEDYENLVFRKGFHEELDRWVTLASDSQNLVEEMMSRERALTGISSLKIRYNSVFGYYIEVPNTHQNKVPPHYRRKQTLTNAERYSTEELSQLESEVLSAQERRSELEKELLENFRLNILSRQKAILCLARQVGHLDVVTSLAWLALEKDYVRPQVGGEVLELVGSRHPVLDQLVAGFTPNDLKIERDRLILMTGPNMAGKSTLMRQLALTVLLAQMGSFVPAQQARLPLFDGVYSRIGASDRLSEGLSTFMVEMTEMAEILREMTPQSLVLLDEIGRGTSTEDGLALARALVEHLLGSGALVVFATHYRELSQMEDPRFRNWHMAVEETEGEVRFLYTLAEGAAEKSYGVFVAKLAGLPESIVVRAEVLLNSSSDVSLPQQLTLALEPSTQEAPKAQDSLLENQLRETQVERLTPLAALNLLAQWKQNLS